MSAEAGASGRTGHVSTPLDEAKVNRFQLKIMFVSGMGFFTDAYDLFVIGIVVDAAEDPSGTCRPARSPG